MSNINQGYNDRVRYILQNKNLGSVLVSEPEGWKSDDKELTRHEDYHGIFPKFSNSLKFYDDAKEFIVQVYDIYGINEDIRLVKDEKHPKTDIWTRVYDGYLDLTTLIIEEGKASIKFNSGGLESILKSRVSEEVEITRERTLGGNIMDPLELIDVELEGRRIFLETSYEVKETENSLYMNNQTNGQTRGSNYPVPMSLINKSHEEAHSPSIGTRVGDDDWNREGNGEAGLMFLAVTDVDRVLRIKFKIKFRTKFESYIHPDYGEIVTGFDDINFFRFWFSLITYQNSSDFNYKEKKVIYTTEEYDDIHYGYFEFSFDEQITISQGDSLALVLSQNMDGANGHIANLKIFVSDIYIEYFEITEDSYFDKTISKSILPYELADRLLEIYTDNKCLYSDALGRTDIGYSVDGYSSMKGITNGLSIRGFNEDDDVYKPITISLKDFLESYSTIDNLGLGIERIGFRERVRIEELSFFYNKNVTIRLPNQVNKLKRTITTDYSYNSIEIGYEKGGSYEEAFGLDEYNGKSKFSTIIRRGKNIYSKISKIRADSYGIEFARRKQKTRYSKTDTRYDNDLFFLDLKRGISNIFNLRKWQDDFEELPEGTFSPETSYNLRLSPFNCLLRHGWVIGAGLTKYLSDLLTFSSSNVNSNLKTKLTGQNPFSENGYIQNSELQRARYVSEYVEFEHELDFDLSQLLQGSSNILGREIPNMYGCIEFFNEKGEKEKGYLINLKPDKGLWKLLKAQ